MYDSTRRIFGILSATGDPGGTGRDPGGTGTGDPAGTDGTVSASGPARTGAHRSGHGQWTAP